jgi:hypothetical protein
VYKGGVNGCPIPWQRRDTGFGRRRPVPVGDVDEVRTRITAALNEGKASFTDVVRARYWQTHSSRKARPWRELGDDYYDRLVAAFDSASGPDTNLAVYGPSGLGVYTTASEFRFLILSNALRFDWSHGQALVNRISDVADHAKEWWGPMADRSKGRRKNTALAERQRFLDRAMGLMSSVFAAIDHENPPDGRPSPATRSKVYEASMRALGERVDREEIDLQDALQRSAQTCYGRGMLMGAVLVALGCGALGAAFAIADLPAVYGVAFLAGAAGAVISVLQRMSASSPAHRLVLDPNAGQQMLMYFGGVRPFVGGLFGYMIFIFFKGSLFPALSITTSAPLATYAGLGFLGGFNERWAQDMLVGSAKRLEQESG